MHGKSAYKHGQLDPAWQQVVDDVKAGIIQVVVMWKVDRFDRQNMMHAVPMANMVLDAGGRIEFATQPIDLSTGPGRMAFAMYCEQAYEESKTKSDRIRIKLDAVRENQALWGREPFGYQIAEDGKYKYLELDPYESGILKDMVRWYLDDGLTLVAIARKLDELEVPTSNTTTRNGWAPKIVKDILRSPASLIGRKYDAKGRLVMKYPGLIDQARWRKLQAALDTNSRRRGDQSKAKGMLADIARCRTCGRVMHYRRVPGKNKTDYVWYGLRCDGTPKEPSTCRNMVPAASVHEQVERRMTGTLGRWPRYETVTVVGHDHEDEIAEVEHDLRELDFDAPDFTERQAALLAERKRLRELPTVPTVTERRKTGDTLRQHWATLQTDAERRAFLMSLGVVVYVRRDHFHLEVCGELVDQGAEFALAE